MADRNEKKDHPIADLVGEVVGDPIMEGTMDAVGSMAEATGDALGGCLEGCFGGCSMVVLGLVAIGIGGGWMVAAWLQV